MGFIWRFLAFGGEKYLQAIFSENVQEIIISIKKVTECFGLKQT